MSPIGLSSVEMIRTYKGVLYFQADGNGLCLHDGEDWQHGGPSSPDPRRGNLVKTESEKKVFSVDSVMN